MQSIIVGTAGHIDHGKSALVRALTGKDPDRLPEEKRRGITIDLGFADLKLDGVRIGFVDVPGHERFVKNMLAGAHGIDLLLLVVAADEGVMPQTREHFDICRLLGIRRGIVVITKTDLAEKELADLVGEEIQELVSGSFLEGAPIVQVSAKTGAGLDELKRVLTKMASELPERSSHLAPRLPVDRVFTMKGFGAVITGTLVSGFIQEGDELQLLPAAIRTRARGLQVHGQNVSQAVAGQRTAINLGGVDIAQVERGMVLAPSGRLQPSQVIDAKIEVLSDAPKALRTRARIRLHIHAAEVLGRVAILNHAGVIAPGEAGLAQLRLEVPIVTVAGERFVLRSYSPAQTIAGGIVLDPLAPKHRGKEFAAVTDRLDRLSELDPLTQLITFVAAAGEMGLRPEEVLARTGWTDETLREMTAKSLAGNNVVSCEGVLIASDLFEQMAGRLTTEVKRHHQREPLARGLARETLREKHFSRVRPETFRCLLSSLEQRQKLVLERDVVRDPNHSLAVAGADADLRDRLARIYQKAGIEPPSLDEAYEKSGLGRNQVAHGRKVLQLLIDSGELVRVQPEMLFHRDAVYGLREKLTAYAGAHAPEPKIDVATFKKLAGVSRKYAIPLLEHFDREHVTRRSGDSRIILK